MEFSMSNIPNIIQNTKVKQIFGLYTSLVLSVFAGIGVSYALTHNLTPEVFGDLKFIQNLCSFLVLFITWGYFYTGTLAVARSKEKTQKHQLIGAITIVTLIMSGIYIIIIFSGSWLQSFVFKNNLGPAFRIFAPFMIVYPFELYCLNILVGDNKIHSLSIFRLVPKLVYLLTCILWHRYITPLSLYSSLGLYLFSLGIFIIYTIYELKPSFKNLKESINIIQMENKGYGLPLFSGSLFSTVSTQLGGISIAYFIDNSHVGFYSLAITATMPLSFIPSTIGTAFFKEFTDMAQIPKKIIYSTVILSFAALIVFIILIKPLIILLYTKEYIAVVPLAYYTAIGATLQGFGDLYNRYISAQGMGTDLRNISLVVGLFNVIGYTTIVYFFGINGAAATRLLAGLVYFALMWVLYNKFIRNVK
jgi:O-antigen/teichoic acid export membrane protein